jgi:hypothetical protein
MPGTLVNPLDSFGVWSFREAPHHPRFRIAPCPLKVDTFLALDVQIGLMGCL